MEVAESRLAFGGTEIVDLLGAVFVNTLEGFELAHFAQLFAIELGLHLEFGRIDFPKAYAAQL